MKGCKEFKFKIDHNNESGLLETCLSSSVALKSGECGDELITEKAFGTFSLYLDDRFKFLSIDDENKIVSGLNVELFGLNVETANIKVPTKQRDGLLILSTDEKLPQGCGKTIETELKNVRIDKESKILALGEFDHNKIAIRFLKNSFVQLSASGKIAAILLQLNH